MKLLKTQQPSHLTAHKMKSLDTYFPKMNPILLGFFISLLGSLPLGYINVVGLQILLEQGIISHVLFVLGIVFIQFFVLKSMDQIDPAL